MKKTAILLAVLLMMTAVTASYAESGRHDLENPPVDMPLAEPDIDGVISAGEGWSDKAYLNTRTAGSCWAHNAMTSSADLYFAYSTEGIYFAGDITERGYVEALDQNGNPAVYEGNSFIYSTGLDDIDIDRVTGVSSYGWNGDIFTLMIDPGDALFNAGFTGNADYTPWYNVGLFRNADDSETAKVFRTKVNNADITESVRAAGRKTQDGWVVEAFIPWDIIIQDIYDLSFGEVQLVKSDLTAQGAECTAAIMYHDRFHDPEGDVNDTWGRYITTRLVCADGTDGFYASGDPIKCMGMKLVAGAEPQLNPFADVPEGKWYTAAVMYCYEKGYMSGTTADTFEPKTVMDRSMFATILYKIDGAEDTYDEMSFADVEAGKWYSNAVEWAYRNSYATGTGTDAATGKPVYGRKNDVSREQLALFFYKYSSLKGCDVSAAADLSRYTDLGRVHVWALDAVKWAVAEELISGTSETTLSPRNSATRAEVATIIMNYTENIIPAE